MGADVRARNICLLVTLSTCGLFAAPAKAATDAERIRQLEARVEAQDALIRELTVRLDGLPAKPVAISTTSAPAPAPEPWVNMPAVLMADGVTIKPRGRLQADALLINSGDGSTPTGTQLRRVQFGAEGRLSGGFRYSAEAAFAGGKVGLEDVLLAYQADDKNEIQVGYFKPPITADDLTSDNHTLFLERSAYANTFAPGRRLGIGISHFGKNWGLRGVLSGERDDATLDGNRQEAWVVSGRGHVNLLGSGSRALHIAMSSYYARSSSSDLNFSFSQKPETNRALEAIHTGNIPARSGVFFGGEVGFSSGAFLVQVEGGVLQLQSSTASDPRFWGWSAQVSWRLTGEARAYESKSGVFGRVVPLRPAGSGGLGAVELGLRAGQIDLTDGLVTAGQLTTYGVVINWNPVTHTRFGANVILADTQRLGFVDTKQTTLTVRAAVDW